MRSAGGTIANDIDDDITTLARLMKLIRQGDGLVVRFTDHDEDIVLDEEVRTGTGDLELAPNPVGPAFAQGLLSVTGIPATGATVTVGSRIYTFTNGALDATGKVLIGVDVGTTITNLRQAIMAGTGAGVIYATGTTAHDQVRADVTDITLPQWTESTLVTATGVSAYFSNFSANSGAAFDTDVQANNPSQARTADQTQGMWAGVTFSIPRYITHCKIYPVRMWETHQEYDKAVSWWFGPDGHIPHDLAQFMMQDDGFI